VNNEPGGKDWLCVEKWGCSLSLSYSLADYWLAVAGSGYSNNPIYQDKPSSVEEGAWKASALRNRFNLNCSCKKKTAVW